MLDLAGGTEYAVLKIESGELTKITVGSENVRVAFELLQEELGHSVEFACGAAANAVKSGDYEKGQVLVEKAKFIEKLLTKLSELHDQWAEGQDQHSEVEGRDQHYENVVRTDSEYSGPALVMTYRNSSARVMYNDGLVVVLAGSSIFGDRVALV